MTLIKQILANKNMSQNRLSQEARIPTSNISLIVNGKMIPCKAWKQRISAALEVSEDVLFPNKEV